MKLRPSLHIIILSYFAANCLKVIPEAIKITYTNEKFVENVGANIRRYSRTGDYYANLWGTLKHTWANNITIHIIITEYLHNEYRRSFIEFHYKLCDMINKEPLFGQMLSQKGLTCPTLKGTYRLMNMTVQSHNFPNVWPFQKGGGDINITTTDTGKVIATAYVHALFKQTKNKA